MTPKEKAEQLVGQLKIPLILSDTDAGQEIICTGIAKHCALIAVEEIRDSLPQISDIQYYWIDVKAEIQKL